MMLRHIRMLAIAIGIAALALPATAQMNNEQMKVQTADSAAYGQLPVLPSCSSFNLLRGDPNSGPSVLLVKASSGCVVPWHWHTAREELMLADGTGSVEMKGEAAHALSKGTYVLLPGKNQHQFTCKTQCLFFIDVADKFDIHYIDRAGNEIPVQQALQAVNEKPGTAAPAVAKEQ